MSAHRATMNASMVDKQPPKKATIIKQVVSPLGGLHRKRRKKRLIRRSYLNPYRKGNGGSDTLYYHGLLSENSIPKPKPAPKPK